MMSRFSLSMTLFGLVLAAVMLTVPLTDALNIKNISSLQDFRRQLKAAGEKPIVAYFRADWCSSCGKMDSYINQINQTTPELPLLLYKIDIDSNPEIGTEYGVRTLPSLVAFKSSQKLDVFIGQDPARMRTFIAQYNV